MLIVNQGGCGFEVKMFWVRIMCGVQQVPEMGLFLNGNAKESSLYWVHIAS